MMSIDSEYAIEKAKQEYWAVYENYGRTRINNIAGAMYDLVTILINKQNIKTIGIKAITEFDRYYNTGNKLSAIREIIFASPSDIDAIGRLYRKMGNNKSSGKRTPLQLYFDYLKDPKKYPEKFKSSSDDGTRASWKLAENLGISVCPYCNRNFINQKSGVTLDHNLPISDYPLLGISFYNLIPSCSSCNTSKSNKWKLPNPYTIKTPDAPFRFLAVLDKETLMPVLEMDFDKTYQYYKKDYDEIKIKDAYVKDTHLLEDYLRKLSLTSESYEKYMAAICTDETDNTEGLNTAYYLELIRALLGRSIFPEYSNRVPFFKFENDLYKELLGNT